MKNSMKIYNSEFLAGAVSAESIPDYGLPEVAFAGRSNVGKSSLLNSIIHRKNLAKTSSTPGKTQQINFFDVDSRWVFADLPGFGYAVASKKMREAWEKLNFTYLRDRESLRLVCALCDIRHEPQKLDLALIEMLEMFERKYVIVLTKSDKISTAMIEQRIDEYEQLVSLCSHCIEVLPYSSVRGAGREELLAIIRKNTE
jgi:GTP-binding protein